MKFKGGLAILLFSWLIFFGWANFVFAQGAKIFFAPGTGAFVTESTFDVSILLDTSGQPINVIDLKIKFPADKLQIVSPSTGQSFLTLWLQQPIYSNTKGTISFIGGVPEGGINTSNGLISTITFRVKSPGTAVLKVSEESTVLRADGTGDKAMVTAGRAVFNLAARPPSGPKVFSATHPDPSVWYKNNNAIMSWDQEEGVTAYSWKISDEASEIPGNIDKTTETSVNLSDLDDGIWYFHIKQKRFGIFGETSHFQIKIDTTPPAKFKPKLSFFEAAILNRPALVTFFTTDALSGINHYEVGVFKRGVEGSEAPVFVEASSPYRIADSNSAKVVVKAFDNAGNIREGSVVSLMEIQDLNYMLLTLKKNYLGFAITFLVILIFYLEHLISHRRKMQSRVRQIYELLKKIVKLMWP